MGVQYPPFPFYMAKSKLKILMCSEASFINSGFGKYAYEFLSRLHKTDKYEIAEFASYGFVNDPRDKNIDWIYYANAVKENDPRYKEYMSRTDNQFGRWRFEKVLLDFKPDVVCVPPNTLINTLNGYRPIIDIKVGDMVMTHKGRYKPVTEVMRKQHIGNMVKIKANADSSPLTLTEEHPVLIYKKKRQTNQKKSISKIYDQEVPVFVPAKEVKRGDLVVLPKNNTKYEYQTIKISNYIDNFISIDNNIVSPRITNCNPIIDNCVIDYDFGVLMGYIIGDGCIHKNSISITFAMHEKDFIENASDLFLKKFGIQTSIKTDHKKHCIILRCNSIVLAEFLSKTIGTLNNKKIPSFCWESPEATKMGLIRGLFRTDGCYKKNTVSFTTVMKHLAYEIRQLCVDINIPISINLTNNRVYNIEAYGESAKKIHNIVEKNDISKLQLLHNPVRRPRSTHMINGHMVASVKRVRKIPYRGQVYNLSVDTDNSYVANWCVHNCDCRDYWMTHYQPVSPLRQYFHHVLMPTVDSAPQQEEWVDVFLSADAIFTYSDWGAEVLKEQSNNKINYIDTTTPGVNLDVFCMKNQQEIRSNFNVDNDSFIIGSVMRNQKRKLIPELFLSLKQLLSHLSTTQNNQKVYLYLHTTYPDMGWDIPELLSQYEVANHVLFTYLCKQCGHVECSTFCGTQKICSKCFNKSSAFPSVSQGVSEEQLSDIYNLFDLYVQYAIAEGLGIPQVEAGACGIPIATVNYSAMIDMIQKLGAYPIRVQAYFKELETKAIRVYPDNDDLIKIILEQMAKPTPIRNQDRYRTRQLTEQHYNWDIIIKKWENYFDNLQFRADWTKQLPILHKAQKPNKDQASDNLASFLNLCNNHLKNADLLSSSRFLNMLQNADYGFVYNGPTQISAASIDNLYNYTNTMIDNNNKSEEARKNNIVFEEDFIQYAHLKKNT
jgi:glycosyltransferase involved in cell wall biosynthesis